MKQLKQVVKIMIWPVLFGIGYFFILSGFTLYFNSMEKATITTNFSDYIKTDLYQTRLASFLDGHVLWIMLLVALLFVPLFYWKYRQLRSKSSTSFKKSYFYVIPFGIAVAGACNLIFYLLEFSGLKTGLFTESPIIHISIIISTGIIGPIIEELLFRGVIYQTIKKDYSNLSAILLTSILFAFMHVNFYQMIYAFGLSFILIYLYEKYQSLKAPIFFHIACNLMSIFIAYTAVNLRLLEIIILLIIGLFAVFSTYFFIERR